MQYLNEFIDHSSLGELGILGFFVTIGSTITGWMIDIAIRDRGFGIFGNSLLVFLGTIIGWVVAETHGSGIALHLHESRRILIFSASASGLLLLLLCAIKNRTRVA